MSNKPLLLLTLLLGYSAQASASGCNNMSGDGCQETNWYVGGGLGSAQTDVSKADFNNAAVAFGLENSSVSLDKRDTAYELFVGYRFNRYFSVEGGYLDLGERSVSFTGEVSINQEAAFLERIGQIYPTSGDGMTVAFNGSFTLGEYYTVDGRIGLFDWSGNYQSLNGQNQNNAGKSDGTDFWYGVRLNYHVAEQWRIFASYSEYDLDGHDNSAWLFGARYMF